MAKLFFLFLLLLAGAFFFTLTIGARRNDAHPMPASDSDRTQYAQDNPPPAWIGSLIGPLSPKLSLPQKEFSFVGDSLTVQAPAADSHFRNATLRICERLPHTRGLLEYRHRLREQGDRGNEAQPGRTTLASFER